MTSWTAACMVLALTAAFLGFSGVSPGNEVIARVAFFGFVLLTGISFRFGKMWAGPQDPAGPKQGQNAQ